jgi:hypothetical protein
MALAIGRKADQVRVLSDLSGSVVGALIDDMDERRDGDPFADALRRYREEGAPDLSAPWRAPATARGGERAAEVLRHLTRDLLKGVTMPADAATETTTSAALPENVRPIEPPREVPGLEMGDDGSWRPSDASVAAQDQVDARTLRRSVPTARSRYPQIQQEARVVLPPAPKRFTDVTAVPLIAPPIVQPSVQPEPVVAEPPMAAPVAHAAPVVEAAETRPVESVIKQVAAGTEVIAGPFAHFKQLAEFVKALRALEGVHDVVTRQFVRGMVHLRIRHSHGVAFADRLLELSEFAPEIVSSTQERVELKVSIDR